LIENGDPEKMWVEEIMAYFKILVKRLLDGTEENLEKPYTSLKT
jgi:hypothetical protein